MSGIMKKTWKWPPFLLAVLSVFSLHSCQDWGQMDPAAGTDVYARTVLVASYDFEDELDPTVIQTFAYSGGDTPDLVQDTDLGSQVLHFSGGYARLFNPMTSSSAQEAVSLTFWVKQAVADEDDLDSALFCFQNTNGTQWLYLTGNGGLVYEGADGSYSVNTSDEATTGMLDGQGEWHWVAVIIHNDGYKVYVDNNKRIDQTITDFDCSKMVQFMANTAYLYLGYGAEQNGEWWIDDLSIYRNTATSSQIAMPGTGGSSSGSEYNTYITVGSEDCTTGWWTAFSDLVTFTESVHFGFYNYNNGTTSNWCNWLVVVTNGKDRDEDGYAEYFVLRSDAYGWGDENYNGDNISSNFDWDTFCSEMDGAYVDLTLTRNGNLISMSTVVTASSGTTYNYTFTYSGDLEDTIGAFLTCEGSYLDINVEDVYTEGQSFTSGSYLVGPDDCSAGWWSYFSEYYTVTGDTTYPFGFIFYNYNNGTANNWCNWLLVATNGYERDASGYSEYFVLRSDAYGWGTNYNGDNISSNFDWDTFCSDMDGAYVRLFVTRSGTIVSTKAKVRTEAGTTLDDYTYYQSDISTDDMGLFLTVEASYLDVLKVGYFPFADNIEN